MGRRLTEIVQARQPAFMVPGGGLSNRIIRTKSAGKHLKVGIEQLPV